MLVARSPKFKAMLAGAQMREALHSEVELADPAALVEALVQWIYTGECDLPTDVGQLVALLNLADEYMLGDLMQVCQDEIGFQMGATDAVQILTDSGLVLPAQSEGPVKDEAQLVFIEQFDMIAQDDPQVEQKISAIPGLWTSLLLKSRESHFGWSRRRFRRRKSFQDETKRVRFKMMEREQE